MTEGRTLALTPRLGKDIEEILQEAQHRWLRPVEICEILRNHHKFHIASEPPNKPPSGSLFLFDRKVLRYFRKDGHNWRKKKDGKTVKEAHEKLKTGSIDVLHCYYAHGEDNFFQRRSYWMLEEDMMHIVLVHYRDVKGSKGNFLQNEASPRIPYGDSPTRSNFSANQSNLASQATDLESLNSTQLSEYEDTDSDITQSCSRHNSLLEVQQYGPTMNVNLTNTCKPGSMKDDQFAQVGLSRLVKEPNDGLTFPGTKIKSDMTSWHEIFERCSNGLQSPSFDMVDTAGWANTMEKIPGQYFVALENILNDGLGDAKDDGLTTSEISVSQSYIDELGSLISSNINGDNIHSSDVNHLKQPLDLSFIDSRGLKKNDSFSKWLSNELGVVGNSHVLSNSGIYWSTLESKSTITESNLPIQDHWDAYLVGSSLSHNQLFSILDISPNWAYTETETKVLIRGKFLVNKEDVQNYNWSCMFGEIEVRADILADGILCCHAPSHKAGRVPLCVTCSNRFPCSEIREFAYKMNGVQRLMYIDSDISDIHDASLLSRLENLLTLDYINHSNCSVCSMMMEVDNELLNLFRNASDEEFSGITPKGRLLQEPLKEKLHTWLLHKVGEDGKGPNVFDKKGQGVLHLAAALGYDWAIKPVIAAGVSINFRDVHGWTALHWAAFCGRERTVVTLIALDASPGAVTDPTPEFPSGRTPADLASQNGYKGISGFLAESSLVNHLQELTLKDSENFDLTNSSELLSYHHDAKKGSLHNTSEASQTSLKDSLSAVRNATEAAAQIYQVFRVQSFNRKKLIDYSDEKCKFSDEDPLSFISVRSIRPRKNDLPVHAAAIKIQKKFRGWKGRKEFLSIRQHIIKIQAHVRGHQVRKHYRKILWSVGIVEKAILRWRRKGTGLRGFRSELLPEVHINQNQPINEDDYDFLQVGRKQTEARLETALARVKSMVQYPEARDQYSRLLNVVEELQESNFMQAETPDEMLEPVEDLMLELEGLLGD